MNSAARMPGGKSGHTPSDRAPDIIHKHDFKSLYQPIFSPTHQRLAGYEALVRAWHEGHPVPPPVLFRQAAAQGQTVELDRHLLRLHLRNFSGTDLPVWLFLNISPQTCTRPDASLEQLAELCHDCGMPPERIVLELVETAADNTRALLAFVRHARSLGFQVAIDDFGMGDSNFERLWRINPLIVKLDRSLLLNAGQHPRARMLLESLVRMIRESGSLVLLEGIEDEDQARIALATEADLLQGYLFGRPGTVSVQSVTQAETELSARVRHSRRWSLQHSQEQDQYLRRLRTAMRKSGQQLARGIPFGEACAPLLQLEGVKRCFVLDPDGIQQGRLMHARPDLSQARFNPLYESSGACWAHRDYFRKARLQPHSIHCSRPYVGLPDARRTVTVSTALNHGGRLQVLCVDIHPDELFRGQMQFPDTL